MEGIAMARQTHHKHYGGLHTGTQSTAASAASVSAAPAARRLGSMTVHDKLSLLALLACIVCSLALALMPRLAFADDVGDLQVQADSLQQEADELQAQANDLQVQVEATAAEYNDAVAKADELQAQVDETQSRIDELNTQLPEQKARSARSLKTLYIMQEEGYGLLEAILSSETMDDFLTRYEYMSCMNSHNNAQLQKLQAMIDELDEKKAALVDQQAEAQAEVERAQVALTKAQEAREEAQAAAIAKAQEQAEAAAAAEMAEQERAAKEAARETGRSDAVDAGNDAMEQPESDEPEEVTETVQSNDVEWSSERDAFISEWAGRIDNYLAGSPMAGQGRTFAAAAWDSGVDPRWSPAISTVESSTGAICFMPYNAWGWGSYSFGSWEEAIPAHVAYLGGMYGSTITPEAASIYCPPNATFWYNRCLEEMNKI